LRLVATHEKDQDFFQTKVKIYLEKKERLDIQDFLPRGFQTPLESVAGFEKATAVCVMKNYVLQPVDLAKAPLLVEDADNEILFRSRCPRAVKRFEDSIAESLSLIAEEIRLRKEFGKCDAAEEWARDRSVREII
jgi:hypothetical protein